MYKLTQLFDDGFAVYEADTCYIEAGSEKEARELAGHAWEGSCTTLI